MRSPILILNNCKIFIENTYISFYTSSYENDFNHSINLLFQLRWRDSWQQ